MQVLFLAHRMPCPLDKGEKIRAFWEITALARRGHDVHLLGFVDDPADWPHVPTLERFCASVVALPLGPRTRLATTARAMIAGKPLSLGWFESGAMHLAVRQVLATHPIDVIVAFSSSMAQYVPPGLRLRTVADLVDADSEKFNEYATLARDPFSSWLYRLEGRRLGAYEKELASTCGSCIVVSQREARLVRPRGMTVISNGVDTRSLHQPEAEAAAPATAQDAIREGSQRLIFVGSMDYRPNVEAVSTFVERIWPLVRARAPRATFTIVGRAPNRRVKKLARHDGVTVVGRVADVRPYLWGADACVVPLRIARGVQNKILEAMAAGCPVICSAAAAAGLDAVPGRDLLVAESPADFADAVMCVLENAATSRALARNGRDYVSKLHEWDGLGSRFADTVQACAAAAS
jgi:polysaccharide biosynthesis protein PslH